MDTDVELATLTSLLDLDEFEVVESTWDRHARVRRLALVPKAAVGLCPHCHGVSDERHVCHDRVVADLPMGGQRVELVVRLWQFRCSACDKFFTPRLACLAEGAHATERLLERLADLASDSDMTTAARFFGLPEKTVEGWYYPYLERKRKEPAPHLQPVRSLGIDELSLKKDTRQFCCVLIDHTNGRVLEVLESREKQVVMQWLKEQKESGLLSSVEEVTCDMWDGYVEAAKEVFGPGVYITIDRFHVVKNFHDRFNEARREVQRGLDPERARALKGSRRLWVTNLENLTAEQRAELEALKRKFPELGRLADHREELRQIFEDKRITTPAAAMARLQKWRERGMQMGLKALKQFNKTLENWMEKIANYFVSRSSNGRTEGFNRGLRAILWRACGMRNFNHFRLRVLHRFG